MLNNFIRVIQIARLFIKYDVDKMLVNCGSGKCRFYFYMLPWNWFRKRKVDNIPLKIRMMFEELGPIFVKLGQVISTRKDLLPNDVADELSKLQDRVKPFPEDISMKIIENELGDKISNLFNDFKAEPLASASIAQVHAAQLKNGKDVVIKVVRPDIHKAIKALNRLGKYTFSQGTVVRNEKVIAIEKKQQAESADQIVWPKKREWRAASWLAVRPPAFRCSSCAHGA